MTDRTISNAADLNELGYDNAGLVPVVAQDASTGTVLMVAWATLEALQLSLESGEMHFWSRSRDELWRKGATSGNVLRVQSLHSDCDGDTVLALVQPTGPACHTGEVSCFGAHHQTLGLHPGLEALWAVIRTRANERPEGSYTVQLLDDENLRLKKLGEEVAELLTVLARGESERIPEEAADLLYHLLVALEGAGGSWSDVLQTLEGRG